MYLRFFTLLTRLDISEFRLATVICECKTRRALLLLTRQSTSGGLQSAKKKKKNAPSQRILDLLTLSPACRLYRRTRGATHSGGEQGANGVLAIRHSRLPQAHRHRNQAADQAAASCEMASCHTASSHSMR